ncbi:MAG: hypothetical protein GY796_03455 [Chloroflexi bacterium]|nr:hypothetical protein [Chloroflexota bacterium]
MNSFLETLTMNPKTPIFTLLTLFILLFFLSACTVKIVQIEPRYAQPTTGTGMFQPFHQTAFSGIEELGILSANVAGSVVAMKYLPDQNRVAAAYRDGYLRVWDLETKQIVTVFDFGFIAREGTAFSADGSLIITPNNVVEDTLESDAYVFTLVDGINLWETQAGTKVDCFGDHCYPDLQAYGSTKTGATLHPSGNWLVYYGSTVVVFHNIDGSELGLISNLDNPDDGIKWYISKLVFDPTGEYYAIAYEEGHVVLYEFYDAVLNRDIWAPSQRQLGKPQNERTTVTSVAIDDTRTWLALLQGDNLKVWTLRSTAREPSMSFQISTASALAFDRSGNFLVVGTKMNIHILDLNAKVLIAQFETAEVTTLLISPDNRMLLWGDVNGVIHLWGTRALSE